MTLDVLCTCGHTRGHHVRFEGGCEVMIAPPQHLHLVGAVLRGARRWPCRCDRFRSTAAPANDVAARAR